ncbi:MAG TPA: PstS family phosphate ABC transporter substrate-binding protein [Acidimicrobiia bacterium]|nr:PstS family phosphate ABC transporter substrate-binding protein [Acidimicrobiia bacterium]
MTRTRRLKTFEMTSLLVLLALVLAACSSADSGDAVTSTSTPATTTAPTGDGEPVGEVDPVTGLPVIDPFAVEGNIVTAGSSTVFPLSEAVSALFIDEGYGGQLTVDSIGSGGGFERFCVAGESDISNASRPINDEEVAACQSIGRDPLEFRVGTDALAVVVSTGNYFVDGLTLEELALAFSTATTWDQVNPAFPAHPIAKFSPGTDSGTFDYFVEEVFDEDEGPILAADPQLSEDDNVLVQGVSGDGCTEGDLTTTCAISYFGYAYFTENTDILKAIAIEGVEPSAEAVNANTYPLARPLFIYSAPSIIAEKPHVGQFIAFYLNNVNQVIDAVGYFPAPQEIINAAAAELAAAMGM